MPKKICLFLAISMLSLNFAANSAVASEKSAATKHAKHATVGKITGQEIKSQLDAHKKLVLVEALEPEYYEVSHLPGAIRLTEPEKKAGKLLPDKSAEIVVYCMNTH